MGTTREQEEGWKEDGWGEDEMRRTLGQAKKGGRTGVRVKPAKTITTTTSIRAATSLGMVWACPNHEL